MPSAPPLPIDNTALFYSLAVAEHLGFRKAAAALGVEQSVLSRRVRALEDQLQVSLFERHSRGIRLTAAGERFLEQARSALSEIDYAAATARASGRGETGRLRIGFLSPISGGFLRELLLRYGADHPQVSLELREASRRYQLTLIRERRLDVAFIVGSVEEPGCSVAKLWSEPVFVAIKRGHGLEDRSEVHWLDLQDEHFIVSQSECGAEVYDHLIRLAGQRRRPDIEQIAVGRDTLLNMVGLGLGVSLVTETTALSPMTGVVFRPLRQPSDNVSFSAVWSIEADNPALRQFISLAHVLAGKARKGTSDWTGKVP